MVGPVLVTGGTGAQGGAVARELIAAGYSVHIIARDPQSTPARNLASIGVQVFPGNFDSVPELTKAASGCAACFINVSPVWTDPNGERQHVSNILSACKAVGVRQVVQSSVAKVDRYESGTFIDFDPTSFMASYWASKSACEKAVREASFLESWTIIRPPRLMNTYVTPLANMMFPALAAEQCIRTALKPELKQDCVDPLDVGKAVREILEHVAKFQGKTITLTGEKLTMSEIIDAMNKALGGEKVRLEFYGEEEAQKLRQTNPIIGSELFLNANRGREEEGDSIQAFDYTPSSAQSYFEREMSSLKQAVLGI